MENEYDFYIDIWNSISINAKNIIIKCLQLNPNNRLSIYDILESPWLKDTYDNNK